MQCQRCGIRWASASLDKIRRQPCRGCPSGRLLASAQHNTEYLRLMMTFSVREMEDRGAVPIPDSILRADAVMAGTRPEEEQREEEDPFGHLHSGMDHAEPAATVQEGTQPIDVDRSAVLDCTDQHVVEARAHLIRRRGAAAWCEACGRWAISRVGRGLSGVCSGVLGSYAVRRARLREGKHPLTGRLL